MKILELNASKVDSQTQKQQQQHFSNLDARQRLHVMPRLPHF